MKRDSSSAQKANEAHQPQEAMSLQERQVSALRGAGGHPFINASVYEPDRYYACGASKIIGPFDSIDQAVDAGAIRRFVRLGREL